MGLTRFLGFARDVAGFAAFFSGVALQAAGRALSETVDEFADEVESGDEAAESGDEAAELAPEVGEPDSVGVEFSPAALEMLRDGRDAKSFEAPTAIERPKPLAGSARARLAARGA